MMFSISIMHHLSPTRARHVKKKKFFKWWQLLSSSFFIPFSPSLRPQSSLKWPPHWICWLKVKLRTFWGCVERLKFTLATHKTKTMADNSSSLQFPAVERLALCGRPPSALCWCLVISLVEWTLAFDEYRQVVFIFSFKSTVFWPLNSVVLKEWGLRDCDDLKKMQFSFNFYSFEMWIFT